MNSLRVGISTVPRIVCVLLLIQLALGNGNERYNDYDEKKVVIKPIFPAGQAVPTVPLSPAILLNNGLLWSSAIFGTVAHGGLVEGFEPQAQLALSNVQYILEVAYMKLINVVKVEIIIADIANVELLYTILAEFFTEKPFPALVISESPLPAGALVQIVITAIKGRIVRAEPPPSSEEYKYKHYE